MSRVTPRQAEALLFDNYGRVAAPVLGPMLDWLLAVRAHFQDDLDLFLIFIVIGMRTLGHPSIGEVSFASVDLSKIESYPSLLTNVRSVSASTGLPYETTRRKVDKLLELGWIERREGGLAITPTASVQFAEVRSRMLAMVAANHALVDQLLAEGG
jgi:hypothetical protein